MMHRCGDRSCESPRCIECALKKMSESSEDESEMCFWFLGRNMRVSMRMRTFVDGDFRMRRMDNLGVDNLWVYDFVVDGFVMFHGVVKSFVVNLVCDSFVVNSLVVFWCRFVVNTWMNNSFVVRDDLLGGNHLMDWFVNNWLVNNWLLDDFLDVYNWLVNNWLVNNWLVNN